MSLLTIIQTAADRIGVVRPTAIIGSADIQVRNLLGLAQQEGRDLASRFNWQALTKEKTFTAVATAAQPGAIPTDFDRMIDGSMWNRTRDNWIAGPMTIQDWQAIQATVAPNVTEGFRIRGDSLLITPTPTAGDIYAYEYVSLHWASAADGTAPTRDGFESDTDIAWLREELITLGVVWRFLRARGLDYSEAFTTYEIAVKRAMNRDGGSPIIVMGGPDSEYLPPRARTPDGNWNL
jgi:hypothetical protein